VSSLFRISASPEELPAGHSPRAFSDREWKPSLPPLNSGNSPGSRQPFFLLIFPPLDEPSLHSRLTRHRPGSPAETTPTAVRSACLTKVPRLFPMGPPPAPSLPSSGLHFHHLPMPNKRCCPQSLPGLHHWRITLPCLFISYCRSEGFHPDPRDSVWFEHPNARGLHPFPITLPSSFQTGEDRTRSPTLTSMRCPRD